MNVNYSFENISDFINVSANRLREEKSKEVALFFLLCVAINLIGGIDLSSRKFLYLDMLGTALAGIALGPWWAASIGLVTNLLLYIALPLSPSILIFAVVNVFGGIYWGYMCNAGILNPIIGITSIQKITSLKEIWKTLVFIFYSGGLFLSIPVIYISKYVYSFLSEKAAFLDYFYRISSNITDKLLCVVIASVIVCSFFPSLAAHLNQKKINLEYGVSNRSIFWFSILYLFPFLYYMLTYPKHWLFWIIPYLFAFLALFKVEKKKTSYEKLSLNMTVITFGALFWLILISFVTFIQYIFFAVKNLSSKFNVYHAAGIIKYQNIFADAFALSVVIALIGVVAAVLTQAVKQRENREIIRRVEQARDKIATDIHNDPLQIISVLKRKVSSFENNFLRTHELVKIMEKKSPSCEELVILENKIVELKKSFSEYYSDYLNELDLSIRKIIKPLSNKDYQINNNIGFIEKIKDIIQEFAQRNDSIKVDFTLDISEYELPNKSYNKDLWKIEMIKIFREILNNIEKHSNADVVKIELNKYIFKGRSKLIFVISDNGKGFEINDSIQSKDTFGIYEIKTRAKEIGANLSINCLYPKETHKRGTLISIELPYEH